MPSKPSAEQVADLLLPMDGPYHPDAVVQAALTMAELVRRLNHATLRPASLRYPSQLHRTVHALRSGLSGLEQTFGQLAKRLDRYRVDPQVGHDRGGGASAACAEAAELLRHAAAAITAVTRPLDNAGQIASHLSYHDTSVPTPGRAFPPPAAGGPGLPAATRGTDPPPPMTNPRPANVQPPTSAAQPQPGTGPSAADRRR